MESVDASPVGLAEETGVLQVLTLDRRGFDAYRVGTRRDGFSGFAECHPACRRSRLNDESAGFAG